MAEPPRSLTGTVQGSGKSPGHAAPGLLMPSLLLLIVPLFLLSGLSGFSQAGRFSTRSAQSPELILRVLHLFLNKKFLMLLIFIVKCCKIHLDSLWWWIVEVERYEMDINYIEEFVVLAEVCNYGRAADTLFISQSSLFNHIKALEGELGIALFNRQGKKIVLSDYGQLFLPYAATIISASKAYAQAIQNAQDQKKQKLTIGTQYRIVDLLKAFRKQYPNFDLHMFDNYGAMEVLARGACELAFIRDITEEDRQMYNVLPYLTDNIVAVTYASHPLAKRKSVRLIDLRNENFIIVTQSQNREYYGMQLCKQAGFVPRVVMTAANGNEAARLVNDGIGISLFLRGTIISEEFDNLSLIDLSPPVECSISLCWRRDKELSEAAKAFVDFVKNLKES